MGVVVGDDVNQLALYPAEARSSGEFMQAVLEFTDVRAVVEEMRGRGAWFKDSEGNLIGVVSALGA